MAELASPPPVLVCIPARWGSKRLPGKPLRQIGGRTLLERVIDRTRHGLAAGRASVLIVATDDARVASEADRCGCAAVMTPASITSGSERSLAAAELFAGQTRNVISIQGDAIFFPQTALADMIDALHQGARVVTPVVRLTWDGLDALRLHKRQTPFSGTTCIRDASGRALWFSKQIIPAIRHEQTLRSASPLSPIYQHIGLYGYDVDTLRQSCRETPSRYEQIEELEQLRFLERGVAIQTVVVASQPLTMGGVDTELDITLAERLIAQHGDPFGS